MLRNLARLMFASVAGLAALVFSFQSYIGYHTWKQAYAGQNLDLESVIAAVDLMVFIPGAAPLTAALYFLLFLRRLINNCIGIVVVVFLTCIHLVVAIFSAHSEVYAAFLIGISEVVLVGLIVTASQRLLDKDSELKEVNGSKSA